MRDNYGWEIESSTVGVMRQYAGMIETGANWKLLDPDKIVRISIIPNIPDLPRYDFHVTPDVKFERRFGRGFMRMGGLFEYLQVVVMSDARYYIKSSTGEMVKTDKDYEVYL